MNGPIDVRQIRRVVTVNSAEGQSRIVSDGIPPNVVVRRGSPTVQVWASEEFPPPLEGGEPRATNLPDVLPPGATKWLVSALPPNAEFTPVFHRTTGIDYVVVLSGEVTLKHDEDEVRLRAGDCVVQRGTNHAWINDSDTPCIISSVQISTNTGQ